MSKKVLIVSASPRKGGNSDVLCDRFLAGALEAGHQAEKIFLFLSKTLRFTQEICLYAPQQKTQIQFCHFRKRC